MRDPPHVAVLVLAAALVVAPVAAAAPTGPFAARAETPANDTAVAPGEQLSGAVSVQAAEIDGEVDERTFGVRVAQARSNASKAAVVAEQVEDVEARIAALEQRKRSLEEARRNGSMSEGEYRARMATVVAELATARRLANVSAATARGLPADVLAERGVDVDAIRALSERARNLTGPEVAEIARSVAGADVGRSMSDRGPPGDVGPPGDAGPPNGSDGGPPADAGAPNGSGGPPDDTGADGGEDDATTDGG